MSLIETKYNEAIDRMSGKERVERTLSLYNSIYEIVAFQIEKEFPALSERELKRKIAERMYLSDRATQELLRRITD